MRKSIPFLIGTVLALVLAASAGAGRGQTTVSTTIVQHGSFTEPNFSNNPCTGDPVTFVFDGTLLAHETDIFDAGNTSGIPDNVWATFTETGKTSFTDGTLNYSGHFTVWGNFNLNEHNTNNTFTLTVKMSAPGDPTITAHEVMHFAMSATGAITVNFDKLSMTCG